VQLLLDRRSLQTGPETALPGNHSQVLGELVGDSSLIGLWKRSPYPGTSLGTRPRSHPGIGHSRSANRTDFKKNRRVWS